MNAQMEKQFRSTRRLFSEKQFKFEMDFISQNEDLFFITEN